MSTSPADDPPVTAPLTPLSHTFLPSHSSVRLSSSPASTPRVVDSPVTRQRSLRPEMSDSMIGGRSPGADYLEIGSSDDDDDWEDDNDTRQTTRTFEGLEGLGVRDSPQSGHDDASVRKRALSPFDQLPDHASGSLAEGEHGENASSTTTARHPRSKKARQLSLKRISRVHMIHNHSNSTATGGSTPYECLLGHRSNASESSIPHSGRRTYPPTHKTYLNNRRAESQARKALQRCNTDESYKADSILDAHVKTLRTLESLPNDASMSLAHQPFSWQPLLPFSPKRGVSSSPELHAGLSPSLTDDPDRPAHLPSYFVKSPYQFYHTKEFPVPARQRPRQAGRLRRSRDGNEREMRVPGLVASDGEFDLRTKYMRQGAGDVGPQRAGTDVLRAKRAWSSSNGSSKAENDGTIGSGESVVLLTLKTRRGGQGKVEKVVIPSSLTTNVLEKKCEKNCTSSRTVTAGATTVDFDDKFFARQLREGYHRLAGNWLWRTLSARKLRYIQLGQVSVWSGTHHHSHGHCNPQSMRLLATSSGLATTSDITTPFTDDNLLTLFHKPSTGKARYTWVHWARRVAASNTPVVPSHHHHQTPTPKQTLRSHRKGRHHHNTTMPPSWSHSSNNLLTNEQPTTPSSSPFRHHTAPHLPDYITAIQFVHGFCIAKVLAVSALMLAISVAASALWIFEGVSGWAGLKDDGRGERIGPGAMLGCLVLAVEMVVFGAWIWVSMLWG